jgi:hypothetical protein
MENYVSIKLCPVCGEVPERVSYDLGRPGGHGYPGHKSFQYKCECCKVVKGGDIDDIYCPTETAIRRAKETWNEEVDRITEFLSRQWDVKAVPKNNVI